MEDTNRFILESEPNWTIELRMRNNHSGKKVWGLFREREVFSYSENGIRIRDNRYTIDFVPPNIKDLAETIWKNKCLCE